jgi:tagatose 1,6-diphosphate aldolase
VFDGREREPVYDLNQVRDACRRLDEASAVPWVILSAGVGIHEFVVSVDLAAQAGCSGFLCGRAIWQEAVERYPNLDEMEDYLLEDGAINFLRCNAAAEKALPWFDHRKFNGIDNIAVAHRSPEWYQRF